jgi:hypothetical protein
MDQDEGYSGQQHRHVPDYQERDDLHAAERSFRAFRLHPSRVHLQRKKSQQIIPARIPPAMSHPSNGPSRTGAMPIPFLFGHQMFPQ